jgi:hypothetical protein
VAFQATGSIFIDDATMVCTVREGAIACVPSSLMMVL